ncbi:MAG: hypothetical protein AB7I19_07450 [Planctomycetota bacterium]
MIDSWWLRAFALTLAIEVPIVMVMAPRRRCLRTFGVASCTQMFTHPLAWLAFQQGILGWWSVESAVVLVEAAIYSPVFGRRTLAFVVSLIANAISAGLGTLLLAP